MGNGFFGGGVGGATLFYLCVASVYQTLLTLVSVKVFLMYRGKILRKYHFKGC